VIFPGVSPSAGDIGSGAAVELTITLDREKLAAGGLKKGMFLVRMPDGLSRPVAIDTKP
jgi:hypothetical protein